MNSKALPQLAALVVILALGIFLRAHTTITFKEIGYDEYVYTRFIHDTVQAGGVGHYREVVKAYQARLDASGDVEVHPLRMNYILTSYFWMVLFHTAPLAALHTVAMLYGILFLLVAALFAWRAGGLTACLGVSALVAFAPLQVWLAQRALVDGVYACWAVICFWLLWENLRAPNRAGWLIALTVSLFMMVFTKEYALFAFLGFCAVVVANRWIKFGSVTPALLAAMVVGPGLAVVVLMCYAGGIGAFFHFYLTFVTKSQVLDYAVKCQEGPWCRYILDFLMVSPLALLLAVGRMFQLKITDRNDLYCTIFLVACYIPMASVTGGMSLRFAACWDLPLAWLAFSHLKVIVDRFSAARRTLLLCAFTALVCGVGLYEYYKIFVVEATYDPVTRNILHALQILK